jgi:class 3 adenylate cyclase
MNKTPVSVSTPSTIQFDPRAGNPRRGLVVVYDLEGFSRFFNQPDVQEYVPLFINHVSEVISRCIYEGGTDYWAHNKPLDPLPSLPVHEKYLGDGAMYIWLEAGENRISEKLVTTLCNRLWNLKRNFKGIVEAASDMLPVVDVPSRIRFGVAGGTIYELDRKNSSAHEYIGFCINLASRLQKYCPELGFIASARVGLPQATLKTNKYVKAVARAIRGFPREVVIVDKANGLLLVPVPGRHFLSRCSGFAMTYTSFYCSGVGKRACRAFMAVLRRRANYAG